MINLPESFYTWFPLQHGTYIPLYLNLFQIHNILKSGAFIEDLKQNSEANPLRKFRQSQANLKNWSQVPSIAGLEKYWPLIQLNPKSNENIFNSRENRVGLPPASEIWAPAEKFFWTYPPFNHGSSRHILLPGMQLKGSGRNPMATRPDRTHSWGGQYLWTNLKALTFANTYRGILPSGLLEPIGISLEANEYPTETSAMSQNSILQRESESFRLTQVMTNFDPNEFIPKSTYQNFARKELENKKCDFPHTHSFQYASMLALGLNDLNITKENVMLNGALIDYEDVSYSGDFHQQNFTIQFLSNRRPYENPLIKDLEATRLLTSNFHLYLSALTMTQKAYEMFLEEEHNEDLSETLLQSLKNIHQSVYELPESFIKLMELLRPMKSLYVDGIPYNHLPGDYSQALIDFIDNHAAKSMSYQEVEKDTFVVTVILSFKRGKWRLQPLETYYQHISLKDTTELTKPLLRMYHMRTEDKPTLNISDALEFSSQINELLSKNAWTLPYRLNNGSLTLQKYSDVSSIKATLKHDLDIKTYSLVDVSTDKAKSVSYSAEELQQHLNDGKKFILQGVRADLNDMHGHFFSLAPLYLSKN